jgi:hypothetical protein
MRRAITRLPLLAVIAACGTAVAQVNHQYDYRSQARENRGLLLRQHQINLELHRGEISRGEAAALKLQARHKHQNATSAIRSKRYAEERKSLIQHRPAQSQPGGPRRIFESKENNSPVTVPGAAPFSEKGFYFSESARGAGKVCFYNVLRGIRGHDISAESDCPPTMVFAEP